MNPITRNILITGAVLVVIAAIASYIEWIAPVQSQIADLQNQVSQARGTYQQRATQLKSLQASDDVITAKMAQLALFDLRAQERPLNVEEARANNLLTHLMDIFENASISVQAFDPAASADMPIVTASNSPPVADVNQRDYRLTATGLYRDWIVALGELRKLPPTITVSHYKMDYLGKQGLQAEVGVTMDIGFNFLMRASGSVQAGGGGSNNILQNMLTHLGGKQSALPDLDHALASVGRWLCPSAEAAVRHPRHSWRRWRRWHRRVRRIRHLRRLARRRRRVRLSKRRALVRKKTWRRHLKARPVAHRHRRVTRHAQAWIRRVAIRPRHDDVVRRVVLTRQAPERTIRRVEIALRPIAAARPDLEARIWRVDVPPPGSPLTIRPQLAALAAAGAATLPGPLSSLVGAAKSSVGTADLASSGSLASSPTSPSPASSEHSQLGSAASSSGSPPLLTMPLSENHMAIGRAEPFWPIIDATDSASLAAWEARQRAKALASGAKGDLLALAPPTPPPLHDIQVLGIVQIGRLSAAMIRVDGQPDRVSQGSEIGTDYQVRSIGSDFVMIDTPGGLRRYDLLRTWQVPTPPSPPKPGSRAPRPAAAPGPQGAAVPAPPPLPTVP